MSRFEAILTFWFGDSRDDKDYYDAWHARWFTATPLFDQEIRDHFTAEYQQATTQQLENWRTAPRSGLALVLLLDQFPRNMFRGTPRAFATDTMAREVATHLIHTGVDRQLLPVERAFVYMPFMHGEALADQHSSVNLFQQLAQEREYLSFVTFAIKHREVIERFGRFPHRNAILGRPSTPEEVEFLTQPGSSF